MDANQIAFLKENIEDRLKSTNNRRVYYRKVSFRSFIATAILASIITILLGLKIDAISEEVRIVVLIISSCITIINTYSLFFNHKELWIANNEALNSFYSLRFNLEFRERQELPISIEELEIYRKRYQEILDTLNHVWYKVRADDHGKKAT